MKFCKKEDIKLTMLIGLHCLCINARAQVTFSSVDSLLTYATHKNISIQNGILKLNQAKKAKLAAILSIPDITGNASFSYTKNTQLPVNLFPAEVFGGPAGTYKEVQSGVPYVTYVNENIDIKLFNPKSWENIMLYKLNIENNIADNKILLKTLHENIAATYYNIVSLQKQLISTNQYIASAKKLLTITENKYNAGLIKQQDINDAKVNWLAAKENEKQIQFLIRQQYLALKIVCDISEDEQIEIADKTALEESPLNTSVLINNVGYNSSLLKEKIALSNYKQQKHTFYPTLSFFQAFTTQQFNTKGTLFDNKVNWIPSSYIGLRLNMLIPTSNTISQISKAKYDYLLAQKNTEQQKIKDGLVAQQLAIDYEKAVSQVKSNQEIFMLQKETYEKNLNLYSEGLISIEKTLNSFNAMVNSSYSLVFAQVNVRAAKTKIDINNNIK